MSSKVRGPDSEFEGQLVEELIAAGVQVVPQFRVKVDENRQFTADIFISSPQRCVVEIKSVHFGREAELLSLARKQMTAVRAAFEDQVICFLVLVGLSGDNLPTSFEDDWLHVVAAPSGVSPAAAAQVISNRLYKSLPADRMAALSREQLTDPLTETGPLSDVLVNFRTRISEEAFEVLRLEALNFFSEYKSGHYTTSALCVGRMLEFVVYTLAKAWRVPINKRTISILEDLEGKFEALSKSMVEYAYAESSSEREKFKGKLSKDLATFSASVTNAALSAHEEHAGIEKEHPVNLQSILRDIRKRYSSIAVVRKEIDLLSDGNLVSEVLKMRNRAAHADTSGHRTEYAKVDIDVMLENLRSILFLLGNVADAIDRQTS